MSALPQSAERDQESQDKVREALASEGNKRAYKVLYEELSSDVMFEPEWLGNQILVRVNTNHPLYQVFYGELLKLAGATRAKDALDLVLIMLARAELRLEDEAMAVFDEAQRRDVWSPFLRTALQTLAAKERLEEVEYAAGGEPNEDAHEEVAASA